MKKWEEQLYQLSKTIYCTDEEISHEIEILVRNEEFNMPNKKHLWDNTKWPKICVLGAPEGIEERRVG